MTAKMKETITIRTLAQPPNPIRLTTKVLKTWLALSQTNVLCGNAAPMHPHSTHAKTWNALKLRTANCRAYCTAISISKNLPQPIRAVKSLCCHPIPRRMGPKMVSHLAICRHVICRTTLATIPLRLVALMFICPMFRMRCSTPIDPYRATNWTLATITTICWADKACECTPKTELRWLTKAVSILSCPFSSVHALFIFRLFVADYAEQRNRMVLEDEPIYASLPEEEEENDVKTSGSFSARSTLPDKCQLSKYVDKETKCESNIAFALHNQSAENMQVDAPGEHSPESSGSNTSTVNDVTTEGIYEEVFHATDPKRSLSQDTLIEFNNEHDICTGNDLDDDDDDGEVEDDRVSMMSEVSSSTFSSFTTCANQDFDFIVSSSSSSNDSREDIINDSAVLTECSSARTPTGCDMNGHEPQLQPSTVSMAAMYYSRHMLNENKPENQQAQRQRSKLDRRQSFSTAYELRQRLLLGQINRQSNSRTDLSSMNRIEEESENGPSHVVINENTVFRNDMPSLNESKMSKRISSSEDNLLSIISIDTVCGDEVTRQNESNLKFPSKNHKQTSISDNKNEKFNRNAQTKMFVKNVNEIHKFSNSGIPRRLSSQHSKPGPANISIKELKSKKQMNKLNDSTKNILAKPVHIDPIADLGSLWNRSQKRVVKSKNDALVHNLRQPKPNKNNGNTLIDVNSSKNKLSNSLSPSPPSPTRVSSFITSNQLQKTHKKIPNNPIVPKATPAQPNKYKQNARQNAILAKNALLSSASSVESSTRI